MADNRKSVAYLRTLSGANTGPDKDSEKRQKAAIQRYAQARNTFVTDVYVSPTLKTNIATRSRLISLYIPNSRPRSRRHDPMDFSEIHRHAVNDDTAVRRPEPSADRV
jgi:hypothetical protein